MTKLPREQPAEESAAPVLQGFALGPFAIDASASDGELYSDNIFVTKNYMQGDWIASFAPSVTAALNDDGNSLKLRAGANFGRYARFSSEDYNDYYVGGEGRTKLDDVTTLFGGARYDWTHEARESPDAVNGIEPTRYREGDYFAGMIRSFSNIVLRAGGTIDTYDFDNVRSSTGIIDNKDRNRSEYEVGARATYRLSPAWQPFVQAYWVSRDYDRTPDDFGYRRSSTGYRAAAGLAATFSNALRGEAYGGILVQDYDDARFGTVTKPDIGARLTWNGFPGNTVQAFVDRSVEETTLPGSSGYLRTAIGASFDQQIRPDLSMNGHFYFSENLYENFDRTDHISDGGLGLKYFFLPNFFAGLDYTLLHRVSNSALADFYENRVSLRIGAQLAPAYSGDAAAFAAFDTRTAPAGFYAALLAGNGTLVTALDGPRSTDGTLTADFGNNGWQGDLAAGYGALAGRIYLGAEVDAALSSAHWLHNGTGGTRIFGVRELASYEAAARLGFMLPNQALIYGRFGVVSSKFATPYLQNIHYVRPTRSVVGLRFGGGVEFPLAGNLSGRMEYTQTSYADYDVQPAQNPDNFANNENLVRFGAVYHIGASESSTPIAEADYNGFYAGLQAGFGSLISQNKGNRNPPQTLDAQRAGSGATGGAFGGYGVTIDHFYLGAEAEAELSNADWNIKRDPEGRIYSVAKDYTFGAALRAGYIFNGNTLLYGRFGIASTRFANHYHDEGDANYVTPAITRSGLRLGGGVEMPVAPDLYLRLDYTWTRYGAYNVDYVTGIDSFRNSENLFRAGLAVPL